MLYCMKQVVKYYYDKVVKVMKDMNSEFKRADPCDNLCMSNTKQVEHEKELLKNHFKCDSVGKVNNYI